MEEEKSHELKNFNNNDCPAPTPINQSNHVPQFIQLGAYIVNNRTSIPLDLISLCQVKHRKQIELPHRRFSQSDLQHAQYIFSRMTYTEILNLSDNDLHPQRLKIIAPAISSMKNLLVLQLRLNFLTELPDFLLLQLSQLSYLDLADNKLEGEAVKSLTDAFPCLKKLQFLNLSMNPLKDTGVQILAGNLELLFNLAHLYLFNCQVGNPGAIALKRPLKTLKRLQQVILSGNPMNQSARNRYFGRLGKIVHFGVTETRCELLQLSNLRINKKK